MTAVSAAVIAVPASASRTGVAPPRPARADRVDRHRRDRRAEEGEPDRAGRAGQPEGEREHDRRRGARVDAEQAGVGQRVARQRLHQRAGDADRRADHDAQQGPRHAQAADDRLVLRAALVQQRVDDVGERDRARADGEAQQRRERQQAERDHETGAAGEAAASRRRDGASVTVRTPMEFGDPNTTLLGCPNYALAVAALRAPVRPLPRRLRLRRRRRTRRAADAPATKTESGAFPVTIEHKYGSTTIESEPKRVVVVGLREQDALLALGVVPVATTEWFGKHPGAIFPWAKDELGSAKVPDRAHQHGRHPDREGRRAAPRPDPRRLLRA